MNPLDEVDRDQTPCALCSAPLRDDEITTCFGCIARARTCLLEIGELYDRLPDAIATLVGITYDGGGGGHARDDTPVVGGDAMVILAGGTAGVVVGSRRGDRSHAADQLPSDPSSAAAVLASVEDDWRHARGDAAAPYAPAVASSRRYLLEHLRWAAERHPGFPIHLEDLKALRSRMEVVTHDDERPVPAGAPCMRCGGRIVHRWRADGLDTDARECERCGRSWSRVEAYRLAQRAAISSLPESHPDEFVTIADAKRIMRGRVPANTLDQWVKRGAVAQQGLDVRGAPVYRLGDVAQRVERHELVERRAVELWTRSLTRAERRTATWDALGRAERARWRGRARAALDTPTAAAHDVRTEQGVSS